MSGLSAIHTIRPSGANVAYILRGRFTINRWMISTRRSRASCFASSLFGSSKLTSFTRSRKAPSASVLSPSLCCVRRQQPGPNRTIDTSHASRLSVTRATHGSRLLGKELPAEADYRDTSRAGAAAGERGRESDAGASSAASIGPRRVENTHQR